MNRVVEFVKILLKALLPAVHPPTAINNLIEDLACFKLYNLEYNG